MAETPSLDMFQLPAGEFLIGIGYALIGVSTWFLGLGIAYLLYRRWRGDGPRANRDD